MGNWTNPNKVTFEDWLNKYCEKYLVDYDEIEVLKEAWETGYKSGFDDAQYIASLNISEEFNG